MRDLREPADDLAPTLRDLGDLSPDLEKLFRNIAPLVDASATGVPAAERFLEGAEPLLESTHVFFRELNPILAYLSYGRGQVSQFLSVGAAALAGNGEGGYQGNGAGEHYLTQLAIIDGRSLQRRSSRPPWERGNAYIAPNAYARATPLGVIESFDCNPNGGEQRDPAGAGSEAEPPCFVAPRQLFQDRAVPAPARRTCAGRGRPEGHGGELPGEALERGRHGLGDAAVQLTFVARSVRTSLTSGGQSGQVHGRRGGDVPLVESRIRVLGHRQEVEDRAAAVVEADDLKVRARAAGGEQAADVVQQRELAGQQPRRRPRGEPGAGGRRDHAVDPVGAAVGEEAQPLGRLGEVGLHVADRHRGAEPDDRAVGQLGLEPGEDLRLERVRRLRERCRNGRVRRSPGREPVRAGAGRRASRPPPPGRRAPAPRRG